MAQSNHRLMPCMPVRQGENPPDPRAIGKFTATMIDTMSTSKINICDYTGSEAGNTIWGTNESVNKPALVMTRLVITYWR